MVYRYIRYRWKLSLLYCFSTKFYLSQNCFLESNQGCGYSFNKSELSTVQITCTSGIRTGNNSSYKFEISKFNITCKNGSRSFSVGHQLFSVGLTISGPWSVLEEDADIWKSFTVPSVSPSLWRHSNGTSFGR